MRHLRLDPLGGVAGDMFAAALLDAFPTEQEATLAAVAAVVPARCHLRVHHDGIAGRRFVVEAAEIAHPHTAWREIRAQIEAAKLPASVRDGAIGIFATLAAAEAAVHGVAVEAVTFHEAGAIDSIADIVAAAALIAAIGPAAWSVGKLPLGAGRIQGAHGILPVPAPATARLLEGFTTHDDGIEGERVTPTGAAILRYLHCAPALPATPLRLIASGTGFGANRLPGLPNCLRVLAFDDADAGSATEQRLAVIAFEVDDQTAEDLATALAHLRALPGVRDALQMPAFGKKGRMLAHVQILADPEAVEAVAEACFRETTTLGLRISTARRLALARRESRVAIDGRAVRVKRAARPGGVTVKVETDDLAAIPGHAERARLRRLAEASQDE